ncbi:hypothetical protein DRH27_05530, partial [Candidatus Falkowbacteria bacterium]
MDNELYKNKYRVKSARLENYDYSRDGFYFVTICTKDRELFFGSVKKDEMILNEIGKMAEKYWLEIPVHFNNVLLDEFIVMPNHLHGILVIDNSINCKNMRGNDNSNVRGDKNVCDNGIVRGRDAINRVSTNMVDRTNTVNNKKTGGITGKHNPMGKKMLGEIIRWYKGRCKFEINRTRIINSENTIFAFAWQSRFYDH